MEVILFLKVIFAIFMFYIDLIRKFIIFLAILAAILLIVTIIMIWSDRKHERKENDGEWARIAAFGVFKKSRGRNAMQTCRFRRRYDDLW